MEPAEPTPAPAVDSPTRVGPNGLTDQQREFLRLYLVMGNGAKAWIKAFDCKADNEIAKARVYSYRLLKTKPVQEILKSVTSDSRRKLRLEAAKIIREIAAIANSTMGDYLNFDTPGFPKIKPGREISAESQKAIQSIEQIETKTVRNHQDGTSTETVEIRTRVRLHDKIRALQMLCRHLGLDKPASPLESLLNALPLDLQHKVAEVLRSTFRRKGLEGEPTAAPAPAGAAGQQLLNGYHPTTPPESN